MNRITEVGESSFKIHMPAPDRNLASAVKVFVPPQNRDWDEETRTWTISLRYLEKLREFL